MKQLLQILLTSMTINLLTSCNLDQNTDTSESVSQNIDKSEIDSSLMLHLIKLPKGFQIDVFAKDVENARSLCLSPKGTLFVGTRKAGNVYAIVDRDGDYKADQVYTIAENLQQPNGVAFKDGSLYVAEISKIWRYKDIEDHLENPPEPTLISDSYPDKTHHGWKFIAFGPDEKLYVPVGAPCNVCVSEEEIFATITRLNPDGTGREIVHRGVRNTVGFTWHPVTGELWFTDNGRDLMGDDIPACELNHAPKDYLHFGFPYCHQGDLPDPEHDHGKNCNEFIPPVQNLGPHTAPLGMEFYTGNQFPQKYIHQAFIAEHGSWNRTEKIGYRVTLVTFDREGKSTSYTPFAEGWLQGEKAWGRPVDIEWMPDGSMLVSDDLAGVVYRIYYKS